jgi:hypothetical protein
MAKQKNVTEEGVPSSLDLGNVETPSQSDLDNLEEAMTAAGITDEDTPAPSPATTSDADTQTDPSAPDTQEGLTEGIDSKPVQESEPVIPSNDYDAIDLDRVSAPEDVSPRNLVNFNKLRDVAKHYKTQAAAVPELQQQIASLRNSASLPEQYAKELSELRMFKKIFDTENDPEFKQQFDEKVQSLDQDVLAILMKNGLSQETANQIKSAGIDKISPQWWENSIFKKISFVDRERIQKRLAERADVVEQKSKEIERFNQDRETYYARQQEQLVEQQQQLESQIYDHVDVLTAKVPWARYQEIPPNATPDQVKQIESHNLTVQELDKQFQEALYPTTPQSRAEVAAAAVASTRLASSVQDLSKRLTDSNVRAEKLQKELDAIRSAGKSPSARSSSRKASSDGPETGKLSDEDAIEQGLLAAESAL